MAELKMKLLLPLMTGIILWPLLEYVLHRFLGHVIKVNTLFKKEHSRHHAETNYFAPLTYKGAAAILVCTFIVLLVRFFSGSWEIAITFTVGFISMFAFYEWTHWSFHARAPRTKLGMKLRKHHFTHHFHNPKMNHGVTTTIIDKLVGTYLGAPVVMVPKNIALPWLFESGKDSIDPRFAQDFQLK
jgi:sterol desaturase/sphingolipid hydroxylase (fatty acid hydroxylase superfamily)